MGCFGMASRTFGRRILLTALDARCDNTGLAIEPGLNPVLMLHVWPLAVRVGTVDVQSLVGHARCRLNQGVYLIATRRRNAFPINTEARPTLCFFQGIQRQLEVPEIDENTNTNRRKWGSQGCLAVLRINKGAFRAPFLMMLISQVRNRGD